METMYHLFEAAGRVLQGAEQHQEMADEAIKKMDLAVSNLERRTQALRGQIQQDVKTALESSIGSAVESFIKKFQVADQYAEQAALRYQKAIRDADRSVFIRVRNIFVVFIIGLLVGVELEIFC